MKINKIVLVLMLVIAGGVIYFGLHDHAPKDSVEIQAVHTSNQTAQSDGSTTSHPMPNGASRQNLRRLGSEHVGRGQYRSSSNQLGTTSGQGQVSLAASAMQQNLTFNVTMYNSTHQVIGMHVIMNNISSCSLVSGTESISVENSSTKATLIAEQHVDQSRSYSINYNGSSWYLL